MTHRDGALAGGVLGLVLGYIGRDATELGAAVTIVGGMLGGMVVGAAAAGARSPKGFTQALLQPASRQ